MHVKYHLPIILIVKSETDNGYQAFDVRKRQLKISMKQKTKQKTKKLDKVRQRLSCFLNIVSLKY